MTRSLHEETATYPDRDVRLPFIHAVPPDGVVPRITTKMKGVDDGRGVKGRMRPNPEASEIYRVDPPAPVIRRFQTASAHIDSLEFAEHDLAELEFLTPRHVVILLNDGLASGCEWSDGRQSRRLSLLAPNTVMFNPAGKYLRIRTTISRNRCRMLILAVQPTLVKWRGDLEIDPATVEFQQRIALDDGQVRQTLVAIQQELEAPGINGAFYVDAQVFLLLARLIRRASNLAEAGDANRAKGGLPNWRLKQAMKLLEGSSDKMPSLADVAQSIGLHPTSFCRGFKQSTGLSPHRYMLAHRVNRAKEMMRDRGLTLTEIALDCGFSGSSQFSVVFKKISGMSPREFRRSL